jgi:hypothetical protein
MRDANLIEPVLIALPLSELKIAQSANPENACLNE